MVLMLFLNDKLVSIFSIRRRLHRHYCWQILMEYRMSLFCNSKRKEKILQLLNECPREEKKHEEIIISTGYTIIVWQMHSSRSMN